MTVGRKRRREVVMDMGGVVLADGSVGEDPAQEGGAMIGKLVEDQARAGELGMDGEQAGAGGRFQHRVGCRQRRGAGGDMRDRQRRRQLLQGLALGRALGVRRQQRGNPLQHGQPRARAGLAQGRGEGAQEEELRDFAGIIGVLPQPMPFGIAAAESGNHGLAQHGGRDRGSGLEGGQEGAGGGDERARPQGGARRGGRGRVSGRRRIDEGHGDGFRRRARLRDRTAGRSPLDPAGSSVPGHPSSSKTTEGCAGISGAAFSRTAGLRR